MHRKFLASLVTGATALALVAVVPVGASAQAFNFNTTGYFTSASPSCTQAAPGSISVVCNDPGSTLALTFTGRDFGASEPFGFLSGSQVTLGDFAASGEGSVALSGSDLLFTLVINQTLPSVGSGATQGSITGSISRGGGPSSSSLIWMPTELVNIDAVTYDLIFRDNNPGVVISASSTTTIEAIGTVTPEPISMALLGTGLFGVAGAARRRRRKNALEV